MAIEEESIEVASNARRERLRALRAARELSDMPDEDPKETEDHRASGEAMAAEDSVEQAAASRLERLKALRAEKELLSKDDKESRRYDNDRDDSEETEEDMRMNMKFRNYLPHDKQLQEGKLAPAVLPKFEEPVASAPVTSEDIEDPFLNIAPKKPNWDLRRDVQKRLEKLERRTLKAIYELMQQEKEKEAMEVTED